MKCKKPGRVASELLGEFESQYVAMWLTAIGTIQDEYLADDYS